MIPYNVQIENLNPSIWRNLGKMTQCFYKKYDILWLLMKDEIPFRAALEGESVEVPKRVDLKVLFQKYPRVKCIILAEEESLLQYYLDVNRKIESPIDADQYFSYIVNRLSGDKGITYYLKDEETIPPPPWVNFYGICRQLMKNLLPKTCCLLIEIMDYGKLFFQIALTIRDYKIHRISTMDDYCNLLGLMTVEEPLSGLQIEQIKAATPEKVIYYRVEKEFALVFLENKIKTYVKAAFDTRRTAPSNHAEGLRTIKCNDRIL